MKDRYKNFDDFLNDNYDDITFAADIADWSTSTQDSIIGALKSAGVNLESLDDEQLIMDQLHAKLGNDRGREQALELSNEIATMQVKQMQSLRTMIGTQMQITSAYYEQQNAIDTAIRAKEMEYYYPADPADRIADTPTGDEGSYPNFVVTGTVPGG